MGEPHVLEEVAQSRGEHHEVEQVEGEFRREGRQVRRRLGESADDKSRNAAEEELVHGEREHVEALRIARDGDDLRREEDGAQKRHGIAELEGERAGGERHEPDARDAESGGAHVGEGGALAGDGPQHEGNNDAVSGRKEGVLARRGVGEPHRLHPEREEGHDGQHEPRLKARPVQRALKRPMEHSGHEQSRQEEAHADELGRGQHVDGVLHHHEGEPPNNGGRQQHELVHEARDMSLLSHSEPL